MEKVKLSSLEKGINASFQYLYHGLILLNQNRKEEGEYLLNLAIKKLSQVKHLKEKNKGKLILTKKYNLYPLNKKTTVKKMLLDDLVEEILFLSDIKKLKENEPKQIESIKGDIENLKRLLANES
ncbi:MAG: hypothetical protein E7342_04575 [Clostridiales bacterium]|nr:hypothetical protein [Clostridiales bacterium]